MSETPAILQPLERLLNRQLEASSDGRRALRQVSGETLAIKLDGVGFDIYFHALEDRLRLGSDYTDEPAAIISGTPLALAALAGGADTATGRRTGVTIHGDPAVAQDFQRLFEVIKPDWEEELSRLVGDSVAHRIGDFARGFLGWGKDVSSRMTEDFAEYFTEEGRDLPTRTEADDFMDGVDEISTAVKRAEARVNKLDGQGSD